MSDIQIPVYQPSLGGNEKKYVMECLDSSWISSKGKFISEFETKFANYINVPYATSVSNGTVALHLALEALGLNAGDEVIVPTFTYIASVNAIAYTGATPVFVDSREDHWQMDSLDVRQKITPHTKAVMAVHLYGHPCDMDELMKICKEYDLYLIEDCAEAFGSKYKGQFVGTFGDVATFSFFGNKTITTGEGGMVVTPHETLMSRMQHLKNQGVASHRQYWHDVIGYNYRMTNIAAAIGVAQLEQADEFIEKKREIAKWYRDGLHGLPLSFNGEIGDVYNTFWMCSILLHDIKQRDKLRAFLLEEGVETRPLFYPAHLMPMYNKSFKNFPVAEKIGHGGLNLPSWPGLKHSDIERIVDLVRAFLEA